MSCPLFRFFEKSVKISYAMYSSTNLQNDSLAIFNAAVKSVRTEEIKKSIKIDSNFITILGNKIPLLTNIYMVGFGKAVFGMACALEQILKDRLTSGILSVPLGFRSSMSELSNNCVKLKPNIKVYEGAANNIPDAKSLQAATAIKELVSSLKESDLLFVLISGGGSALLPAPKSPLTLEEKQMVTKLLASAGATIEELNCVRKRLSELKGGKLAELAKPAQVISLILSDVVGDPLSAIASGPTVENTDDPLLPISIVDKYKLRDQLPSTALQILESVNAEEPKNEFNHVKNFILGNNRTALIEAAFKATELGYRSFILSNTLSGTASVVGKKLVSLICSAIRGDSIQFEQISNELSLNLNVTEEILAAVQRRESICLLVGGETTVEVKGTGIGGRNQELALAAAIEMDLCKFDCNVLLLSAGTDGIDGPTSAAGAIATNSTVQIARNCNLDPQAYLSNNDSNSFFTQLEMGGWLVKTGHTGTNVMDVIIILIDLK